MGQVAITYRLMPDDAQVDLTRVREDMKRVLEKTKIHSTAERPIAFGLKALEVTLIVEDIEGQLEKIEGLLMGLKGIQSVETIYLSRV